MTVKNPHRSRLPYSTISTAVLLIAVAVSRALAQQTITSARADGAQTALRIFSPSSQGCAPLAIISPGAGGTEKGYCYLAEGLRDRGWFIVVMATKRAARPRCVTIFAMRASTAA